MTAPRPVRPMPPPPPSRPGSVPAARPARPATGAQAPRPQHTKPDPNPMRVVFGLAGLASATALMTAMLPSVTPAQASVVENVDTTTAVGPQPSVLHVTKTVVLQPGQTAPPNSSVVVQPQPTPRVHVKVVTRQSGKP